MRNWLRITGAVVALALVVGGAALVIRGGLVQLPFGSGTSSKANPLFGPATFNGQPYSCPAQSNSGILGAPAITPSNTHPTAEQAAYGVADVRAYLLATPPWVASEQVSIYSIQLMNAVHAAVLLQAQCTGLPDAAPVYFVTLHGDFPVGEWPNAGVVVPTPTGTSVVAHVVTMIFDAHTGNLIVTNSMAGDPSQ